MKYLYISIALALTFAGSNAYSWLEGRDACRKEQAKSIAEERQREKEQYEKDKNAAVENALKVATEATKHITTLQDQKVKVIEHTKTIIVPKPASCDLSTDELRDYNS